MIPLQHLSSQSAIAHAVRCVTEPGDEVLTFAPYFPEYGPYINLSGAVLKVVPANTETFQINFEKLLAIYWVLQYNRLSLL